MNHALCWECGCSHVPPPPLLLLLLLLLLQAIERGFHFVLLGSAPDPKVKKEFHELLTYAVDAAAAAAGHRARLPVCATGQRSRPQGQRSLMSY
jgi:hypothetical protein